MANSDTKPDISLEAFSKVVEAVYDCALDPNHWHDAVRMIADLCESQVSIFAVHDYSNGRTEVAFGLGYTEPFIRLHEEKYAAMNSFLNLIRVQPLGAVRTRAMAIDDREFYESRFYQEWVEPQGFDDAIYFSVLRTQERIGWWEAHRLDSCPHYGDREVRLLTLLSPHVCRAVTISDALNLKTIRSEALEATLNALASSVYLTDRHGRIIYMNRAAEQQVRTSNALRVEHDRLAPVDRAARVALGRTIDRGHSRRGRNASKRGYACPPSRRRRGPRRHHTPLRPRRAAKPLRRLCRDDSDLRARPNRGAAISGRGVCKALWSHRRRAARAVGNGAGSWHQGGG